MKYARLSLVIATLSIVGCNTTPVKDIQSFATTTKESQAQINALVNEYNNAVVEEELNEIAFRNSTITTLTLDQAQQGKLGNKDPLYALVAMNNALAKYVKSLSDLSTAGSQEKVELAVAQLNGSLISLDANYQALTGNDALFDADKNGQIASIVATILTARAEDKRNQKLEEVIEAANPQIEIMIDAAIALIESKKFEIAIKDLRNAQLLNMINDYNVNKGSMSNTKRKAELDSIYKSYVQKITIIQEVQVAKKKLQMVKKGHSKLLAVFKDDQSTRDELRAIIAYLKDANERQDTLEELYSTCETEIVIDKGQIICKLQDNQG